MTNLVLCKRVMYTINDMFQKGLDP